MELFKDFYYGLPQHYRDCLMFNQDIFEGKFKKGGDRNNLKKYYPNWRSDYVDMSVTYKGRKYFTHSSKMLYDLMYDVITDMIYEYQLMQKGLEILRKR